MKRKNTIESAHLYSSFLFISSAKLKQNNKILIQKKKKKKEKCNSNTIEKEKKRTHHQEWRSAWSSLRESKSVKVKSKPCAKTACRDLNTLPQLATCLCVNMILFFEEREKKNEVSSWESNHQFQKIKKKMNCRERNN